MSRRLVAPIAGVLAGLTLAAFTAGTLLAQRPPSALGSAPGAPPSHEQMHEMIDAMHGAGTSERMHEALGDDAERFIEQCMAMMQSMGMDMAAMMRMMAMMQTMAGMMGDMGASALTHEQVHTMMDGMMGAGFAERAHATMPDADSLMEPCAAMMAMMRGMDGAMDQ